MSLRVFEILVWKHTQESKGASCKTNNPMLFYEWCIQNLSEFEIENLDFLFKKAATFNRVLSENPDAIAFDIRIWVPHQKDMAKLMMVWT